MMVGSDLRRGFRRGFRLATAPPALGGWLIAALEGNDFGDELLLAVLIEGDGGVLGIDLGDHTKTVLFVNNSRRNCH